MLDDQLAAIARQPDLAARVAAYPGLMFNIEFPTLGGAIHWETIAEATGWRVQRNKHTGHCRVLNPQGVRIAWGPELSIRKAIAAAAPAPAGPKPADAGPIDHADMIKLTDSLNVVREFIEVARRRQGAADRVVDGVTGAAAQRQVEIDAHTADAVQVLVKWLETHEQQIGKLEQATAEALRGLLQVIDKSGALKVELANLAARLDRLEGRGGA